MIAVLAVYGINETWESETRQGLIFLIFSIFMAFGAVCSWAYLPDIQRRVVDPGKTVSGSARLETKNLEDLGEGWERARMDGERVTIHEKLERIRRRKRGVLRSKRPGDEAGYDMRDREFGVR